MDLHTYKGPASSYNTGESSVSGVLHPARKVPPPLVRPDLSAALIFFLKAAMQHTTNTPDILTCPQQLSSGLLNATR